MKVFNHSNVPIYTVAGSSNSRTLPEWLIRKRKRSLKNDPEFANRVDLLQDFEFEEASSCIRVSEDGDWIMSTGTAFSYENFSRRKSDIHDLKIDYTAQTGELMKGYC